MLFFFFKQKTAYEMRISDWSSDVVSVGLPIVPSCMVGLEVELSGIGVVASGVVVLPWGIEGSDVEPSGIGVAVPVSGDMVPLSGVVGPISGVEIGSASCRERVCQYV